MTSRSLFLAPLLASLLAGCAAVAPPPAPRSPAPPPVPAPIAAMMPEPVAPDPEPAVAIAPPKALPVAAPLHRTFAEPTVPREETRAVVLLYHLFGGMKTDIALPPADLEAQILWLRDRHIEIITAAELASFLDGDLLLPARAAVLTLDDGHVSTYEKAYPILKKHGVRFTLALNTEAIEGHRPEAVTWDQVNEMVASGLCELASHSHIHGHMERLTEASNRREVTLSREIIEERTGVRPETFVFPFGGHNLKVMGLVQEAGYRAAFALGMLPVTTKSQRWALPRQSVLRTTTLTAFARFFPS